jgi:large subunit ribosomal protein L32e
MPKKSARQPQTETSGEGDQKEDQEASKLAALLELRRSVAESRPAFVRPESWRYVRLHPEWRKPKGLDNKVRKSIRGWPRRVKVGYRGPAAVRNYHPSGHPEVLVQNTDELSRVVPGKEVVRIGGAVGARKRAAIMKRANELGLRIVNPQGLRVIEPKK